MNIILLKKKTDTKKINAQKAGHQKYIDRGQLKRLDRLALEVPFRQGLNVKQSVADLISCIALDDSLYTGLRMNRACDSQFRYLSSSLPVYAAEVS